MSHSNACSAFIALALSLAVAGAALAEEESFDPRRPPDDKAVKQELAAVKKEWKKATPEERCALLDRLALLDHERTAAAIAEHISKADADMYRCGLEALRRLSAVYVAEVLPDLMEKRQSDDQLWLATLAFAIDRDIVEVLPAVRKVAAEQVPPIGDESQEAAAKKRTRAIEALGKLRHEDNVPVLVKIMEAHASLEGEQVAHGDAGSDASWPRFYVPARMAFAALTGHVASRAAEARSWLDAHRDWKAEPPVRHDPRPGKGRR